MSKLMRGIVGGILLPLLYTPLPMAHAALPSLTLREAFPALTVDRPMWLAEAPDGSGRIFIAEQRGRIVIVRKDGDTKTT